MVPLVVAQPAASGNRRLWVILGSVIFVAIIAAAGAIALAASGGLSAHHDITGTFELNGGTYASGPGCQGKGGYSDISPGAQVTLKNGAGAILATTQLGTGTGANLSCDFKFAFANVPEVPFYSVEIARRGAVTNSLADMKANGWTFGLSLGN